MFASEAFRNCDCCRISGISAGYWVQFSTSNNHASDKHHRLWYRHCAKLTKDVQCTIQKNIFYYMYTLVICCFMKCKISRLYRLFLLLNVQFTIFGYYKTSLLYSKQINLSYFIIMANSNMACYFRFENNRRL